MRPEEDAFGRVLLDYVEGVVGKEIVERDDGYIAASGGNEIYLAPYRRWPPEQRRAMRFVRGRVLDIGCGAGRVALHLQERGHEVVAIDVSPLAVEASRRRGVRDARVLAIEDVDESVGPIDTIVMYGNNLGLLGGRVKAKRLLRRFHRLTTARGRIVAESRTPGGDPDHEAYLERNRARGRMPGQVRIRVRYRRLRTPWFDYLLVSPDELVELLEGTGWHVRRLFEGDDGIYVAVLDKDGPA